MEKGHRHMRDLVVSDPEAVVKRLGEPEKLNSALVCVRVILDKML
jgi:hypothetical protein